MISKKNIAKTVATLGTVALGVTAATTVANADSVYTVKSGDTLSSISQKFANDNSLVNSIAQDNHIANVNKIFVGQRLVIKGNHGQQTTQTTNNTATQAPAQPASTTTNTNQNQGSSTTGYSSSVSGSDAAAKAWIAARESGGNYGARNGQYIGKYQLSASYLNGDYSAANQERVADQYVASRYGSWTNAQQHWMANGWY